MSFDIAKFFGTLKESYCEPRSSSESTLLNVLPDEISSTRFPRLAKSVLITGRYFLWIAEMRKPIG